MRISDWSSDVCSSDLIVLGDRPSLRAMDLIPVPLATSIAIAMIEVGIIFEVEPRRSAIVELHRQGALVHLFDGAERAVLDAQAVFVPQEHDSIAGSEIALPARHGEPHILAKCAFLAQPFAGQLVEAAHLVIGVGEYG